MESIKSFLKINYSQLLTYGIPLLTFGGYLFHQKRIIEEQSKHIDNILKIRKSELEHLLTKHKDEIHERERKIMELNLKLQLLTSDYNNLFQEQMNPRNNNNLRFRTPGDLLEQTDSEVTPLN